MSDPALKEVYAAIAELWCNPEDVDLSVARKTAAELAVRLGSRDAAGGAALARFLESPPCDDYVETFELDPKCSLYLGSHSYDEPRTCATAGVSERNDYMIDLVGVYRHFGFAPNGKELPDYLPLVIELLSLTAGSTDPTRRKLLEEYVVPHLSGLRSSLERLGTPYLHLFDAFMSVIKLDVDGYAEATPTEATHD